VTLKVVLSTLFFLWISNITRRSIFYDVQWFEVRCDCSLCWYWWNFLSSLFKLSFCNDLTPFTDWYVYTIHHIVRRGHRGHDRMVVLQLHLQSVPITTHNECESRSLRGVLVDTTLCDKVCQWVVTGQCFSPLLRFPPQIKLTVTI
jgi:hypothetical protein